MCADHKGFHYDTDVGLFRTVSRISASVVPEVLGQKEFWGFLVFHLIIKTLFCVGFLDGLVQEGGLLFVSWETLSIITKLATFLSVFYSGAGYGRYLDLYQLTRDLLGSMESLALLMRWTFKDGDDFAKMAHRYVCTSIAILLHEVETDDHIVSADHWDWLTEADMLTKEELNHLMSVPPQERGYRLIYWSADVITQGCEFNGLHGAVRKYFNALLQANRHRQQMIIDYVSLPVPVQYVHILNVMVLVVISLYSFKMALTHSVFAPFTFSMAQMIFLGMMALAARLENPFGTDDVDFPNLLWVKEFLQSSQAHLDHIGPGLDDWDETAKAESPIPTTVQSEAFRAYWTPREAARRELSRNAETRFEKGYRPVAMREASTDERKSSGRVLIAGEVVN